MSISSELEVIAVMCQDEYSAIFPIDRSQANTLSGFEQYNIDKTLSPEGHARDRGNPGQFCMMSLYWKTSEGLIEKGLPSVTAFLTSKANQSIDTL
jgi:hypothetical protein